MKPIGFVTLLFVTLLSHSCHSEETRKPISEVVEEKVFSAVNQVVEEKVLSAVNQVVEEKVFSGVNQVFAGGVPLIEEDLEYQRGSLCEYCDYCKYCPMCDSDCPCETASDKPNCNMCKYCKYCNLCMVCDTTCQAGGVVDHVSGTIISALPKKGEIKADIQQVKEWVERKRDEL